MSREVETMNQPEMADFGRADDEEEEVFDNDVGEENTEVRGVFRSTWTRRLSGSDSADLDSLLAVLCSQEAKFDEMIGVLQDILIDPEFVDMQSEFCRNNCEIFDNVSENKLIYMDIFQQYTDLIGTSCARRCIAPRYFTVVSPSDVAYLYDCAFAETFIERRLHAKLEVANIFQWMSSATRFKSTKVQRGHSLGDSFGGGGLTSSCLLFARKNSADEIPLDVIDVLLSSSDFEEFKGLMLSFKQNETPCIEITGDALIC
ncbi:ADP-ribosylation factor-like protein 2-binding protein [Phytophthora pseudosyringae]|uniref:ADP-ribosylation factor-like protein 2-binding protein n=1 Tax=Phytophthora pseudosyringae TaxID=221518 RepID=A0A8T1W4P0_9STRA|nr:ADP-ribosylation factor-like protein 2-binding protein [Phytophthora pseudosyringae]